MCVHLKNNCINSIIYNRLLNFWLELTAKTEPSLKLCAGIIAMIVLYIYIRILRSVNV